MKYYIALFGCYHNLNVIIYCFLCRKLLFLFSVLVVSYSKALQQGKCLLTWGLNNGTRTVTTGDIKPISIMTTRFRGLLQLG